MHRKICIYRNYSHPDLIGYLDPGFIPLDWTHNPYPQIREVAIHHDFGQPGASSFRRAVAEILLEDQDAGGAGA